MTKEERIRLWESYNSKVNTLERELLDEVMNRFLIRKGYINNREWDGNDWFVVCIVIILLTFTVPIIIFTQ